MVAANPFLASINSGEFSPRMAARVDFEKYSNAATLLRNVVLFPQGGITRRAGTRYASTVKASANATIVLPFTYSQDDSYIVEMGNAYARFFRRQGRISVDDTDAAISNGTFASNITGWDDRSTGNGAISHDSSGGRLKLGTAATSATTTVTLTTDVSSWSAATTRLVLPASTFSQNGKKLTITIEGPTSGTCPITNMHIGHYVGSGDAYDVDSMTPVLFNGSASVTVEAGKTITSDEVKFDFNKTRALVISFYHTATSNMRCTAANTPSGYGNYWKSGDDTRTADATGYTNYTATKGWFLVNAIKVTDHLSVEDVSWAEQDVTVGAGNKDNVHVLQFQIDGDGDALVGFQVGTATTLSDILDEVLLSPGEHSIEFTPGVTTFYVQFRNNNDPGRICYVDNVALIDNAPMEVVSPYASADLSSLRFYQAADVMYLLHPDYAPRRLERRGHRSWSIVEAFYEDGPYLEINGGSNVDARQLFENGLFLNGTRGWVDASAGDGYVEHNNTGFYAELDPGTSSGSGDAIMRGTTRTKNSAKHVLHVLVVGAGPVDILLGVTSGGSVYLNRTADPGWHSYEFTSTATTLNIEFSYNKYSKNRTAIGACLCYNADARLIQASSRTGEVTLTAHGFSPFAATDVGRLMRLTWPGREPGYGVITAYSSATSVTMLVLRELASTAPTEDWRFGAWGGDQGHPKTMGFFDGRAAVGKTTAKPQSFWLSQSADLQNMRPDSFTDGAALIEDDDAISLTLESEQIDPILWMSGKRQLLMGTSGGQWIVESSGPVITPVDNSAKQHTAVPAADVPHVAVNQITLFADRSKREVHDVGYNFQDNSFVATDLTILADHIFRSPVQEMRYQRRPYSIVWCRRADGRLAALSYNRQHDVLGWAQSILGGSFGSGDPVVESIAVIPGAEDAGQTYDSDERDELWMVVKRTINGATVRYIEFMEVFFEGPLREDYDTEKLWRAAVKSAQADAFYVDCGLTYSGSATTTITGLDHLEGETVRVLADGIYISDKTVASGQITLGTAASKVHVGLPYTHKYESLKIPVGAAAGTSVHKVKIITAVGMVLFDTGPFKVATVEYDELSGRRQHDLYDVKIVTAEDDETAAIPLYTGETNKSTEGAFTGDVRLYCEGSAPLPWTLLGLAPEVQTQDTRPSAR